MKNLPLVYFPNFEYDKEYRLGNYLGIPNSRDPRTGHPLVIECHLTTPDKRLEGEKFLPPPVSGSIPVDSIVNAKISRTGDAACKWNSLFFRKNGQDFVVRIDVDWQLANDIDQIFKAVEQEISGYLVPVGEPTGADEFTFNHGD